MDLVDWLLAIGFVISFTVIGYVMIDYPWWLAFPVLGIVLIVLAKLRRDRASTPPQDDNLSKKG
jgi:hypothetical protein